MKIKTFIKSIVCLSLTTLVSINSFAAVLYSPGANVINGPNPLSESTSDAPIIADQTLNKEAVETVSKIIVSTGVNNRMNDPSIINTSQPVDSPASADISNVSPIFNQITPVGSSIGSGYQQAAITTPLPSISAPAFIVINATTKQIYAGKDYNTKYEPAGITNLMTAYLGSTHKAMNEDLNCSLAACKAVDKDAFIAGLDGGDKISLTDAIASMFVRSCADSANVIAENVSGSIASFVELMNQTAKDIGCTNTNFVNPSGLNNDGQLTTAYDMSLIMDKVTANDELVKLLSLSQYTLPAAKRRDKLMLFTRNTILNKESPNYNADVTCSRMGYTSKTGYTMASMCNYKGNRLIVVILKAKGSHFEDTKKLIDFAKLCYEETK